MRDKVRKRAVVAAGGAMYALMAAFGAQAERLQEIRPLAGLGTAALLFVPACLLLRALFALGERRALREERAERISFFKTMCVIFACYVPMLLITFPGSFVYDVPFQLKQVFTGAYNTGHPLAHTLLLGGCVALGRALGSINAGAALYTLVQMAALSACFAGACCSIARQSGARAAKWSAAFFALYPLHMLFAVNATKDVLFGGLFVLTAALLRETMVLGDGTKKRLAAIALCGAGAMLMRSNAMLALLFWIIPALLLLGRRGGKVVLALLVSVLISSGVNTALKAATDAAGSNPRELLSWPIQQMARARLLHGDRFTQEEKDAMDELMPGEVWRDYDPTISDPVKYFFETETFLSDPGKYVKVYRSVGKKCPDAYRDALIKLNYSFWYPYSEYRVSGYYHQMGVTEEYYEWCDFERISSKSLVPRVLASLRWRFGAKGAMQIPVVGWLFNMGLIAWVMLYFMLRSAYLGHRGALAAALFPIALWATYLMGPVMAGRYLYPCICCLPVLALRTKKS